MLVTDSRNRATLPEIMNHPWLIKGFDGPPKNYLPHREPIKAPLDENVILAMTGFEFGPPDTIRAHLTRIIESEDYQAAARSAQRDASLNSASLEKKKGFFY